MEENNCVYIGSMGFRKSADMYNLYSDETVRRYNFENLKNGQILYIKPDAIYDFAQVIQTISVQFVLVSGCSDYTMPDDIFPTTNEFIEFVENPKILRWYVQNCIYKHHKIECLPIGLDYHTMYTYPIYWGSQKTPIEQEQELANVVIQSIPFYDRKLSIYSNCHFLTCTKFGGDRTDALSKIPRELLFLENAPCARAVSWREQINHAFVLSPHGNGLDCHRTWEAVILGCIPIVKSSAIDSLYDNLPVLIIKDWSEITQERLIATVEDFKCRTFQYEKLTLAYWITKMRTV